MLHSVGGGNSPWNHKYYSLCLNEYNWTFSPMPCTNRQTSGVPDDKDRHLGTLNPDVSNIDKKFFWTPTSSGCWMFYRIVYLAPLLCYNITKQWNLQMMIMDDWWLPVSTLSLYVSGWRSELWQRGRENKSYRYFAALYNHESVLLLHILTLQTS